MDESGRRFESRLGVLGCLLMAASGCLSCGLAAWAAGVLVQAFRWGAGF